MAAQPPICAPAEGEWDNRGVRGKTKALVATAAAAAALTAGGVALASATGDDDAGEASEQVRDPRAAAQAREAALDAVGGGRVTEVERADEGDEGYEVEVRKDDGSYREVALSPGFEVASVERDDD